MRFLLMPVELLLMVVFLVRNCMRIVDDDYGPKGASSVVARDACAGLQPQQ